MSDDRRLVNGHPFVRHEFVELPAHEMAQRADSFFDEMDRRRSIRDFSDRPVPRSLVEKAIQTASTSPSGAHRQPWRFVLVGDSDRKSQIRAAAEAEEKVNYEGGRINDEWREALEPLQTTWEKPFLETVPWIVVVFEERYGVNPDGSKRHNYYVKESVGMACGIFVAALHHMGLATLSHTPSPMAFLTKLLGRPENERPFALFPIGLPAGECWVPDLVRKPLSEVLVEP